ETKIQKRYLVAIEQDDFNALPGKFYARAFIKEYAQAVGLDPDEVLQGFDESEIASEEPATQYTRMNRTNQAKDSKGSSFLSFLLLLFCVLHGLYTKRKQEQVKTKIMNRMKTMKFTVIKTVENRIQARTTMKMKMHQITMK